MTTRLPVVGSTAATTAFCAARLEGPGGHLWFDGNGKITAGNGTLTAPAPNAFSLEAAAVSDALEHCPQSTPTCRAACYVGPLSQAQAATYDLYRHNSRTIRQILGGELETLSNLADDWVMTMARWITENAAGGFRWHVSGDVFSLEYARFIADVCRESPTVDHWIYSRSFDFLAPLAEVSTLRGGNLALNLSCDADNWDAAVDAAILHGLWDGLDFKQRLRLCYLTVDGNVPDGLNANDVIFCDYKLRPKQYPTLAESPWWQSLTPLQRKITCAVDAHGKSERTRCGPNNCDRCLK